MEMAHSLLLNDDAVGQMPEAKQTVFVYEWLRYLDSILPVTTKTDMKGCQEKLVAQLSAQIAAGPGPPTRRLLGRCLATVFTVGDTYALFATLNTCNDVLKNRDDSPSQLPAKLAAVSCVGALYERLGRMVGPGFEDTAHILIKSMKNAECLTALASEASFMYTNELESIVSLCFKALEGSNYDVRCAVAKLLGRLLATAHRPPKAPFGKSSTQSSSASNSGEKAQGAAAAGMLLDECCALLAAGFLRGGMGFLKGSTGITVGLARETRIGVAMAYVEFVKQLDSQWLERNQGAFMRHLLDLAAVPARSASAAAYVRPFSLYQSQEN